jgi:hypothetical protein
VQLALDDPARVQSLALLELSLLSIPAAAGLLEKAGPSFAAYGEGRPDAALAAFMSAVSGLSWDACRALLDECIPGAVAQSIADAAAGAQHVDVRRRAGSPRVATGAVGRRRRDGAAVGRSGRSPAVLVRPGRGVHHRGRRPPAAHPAQRAGGDLSRSVLWAACAGGPKHVAGRSRGAGVNRKRLGRRSISDAPHSRGKQCGVTQDVADTLAVLQFCSLRSIELLQQGLQLALTLHVLLALAGHPPEQQQVEKPENQDDRKGRRRNNFAPGHRHVLDPAAND